MLIPILHVESGGDLLTGSILVFFSRIFIRAEPPLPVSALTSQWKVFCYDGGVI